MIPEILLRAIEDEAIRIRETNDAKSNELRACSIRSLAEAVKILAEVKSNEEDQNA